MLCSGSPALTLGTVPAAGGDEAQVGNRCAAPRRTIRSAGAVVLQGPGRGNGCGGQRQWWRLRRHRQRWLLRRRLAAAAVPQPRPSVPAEQPPRRTACSAGGGGAAGPR